MFLQVRHIESSTRHRVRHSRPELHLHYRIVAGLKPVRSQWQLVSEGNTWLTHFIEELSGAKRSATTDMRSACCRELYSQAERRCGSMHCQRLDARCRIVDSRFLVDGGHTFKQAKNQRIEGEWVETKEGPSESSPLVEVRAVTKTLIQCRFASSPMAR